MVVRSDAERECLFTSGQITAFVLYVLKSTVQSWINELGYIDAELLDSLAFDVITSLGGQPAFKGYKPPGHDQAYPATITLSLDEEIVHGLPNKRILPGALVSIDCGVSWRGFFSDAALSFIAGQSIKSGNRSHTHRDAQEESLKRDNDLELKRRLISVCRGALTQGLHQARPHNSVAHISRAIEQFVQRRGFSVIKQLCGHGVGKSLHEPPEVPNFFTPQYNEPLRQGLVIAIEPMIAAGKGGIRVLPDGWTIVTADGSLSCHFEHTVIVDHEPIVTTRLTSEFKHQALEKTQDILDSYRHKLAKAAKS